MHLFLLVPSPQSYLCWKWEIPRIFSIGQYRRHRILPCEIDMKNIGGHDIKQDPCLWWSLVFLLLLFLSIAVYVLSSPNASIVRTT